MPDVTSALLALAVVSNSVSPRVIYTEVAVEQLAPVPDDIISRLSPATHDHINFHGRYDFTNLTPPDPGQLRPLGPCQPL